jgi:putative addiction module component (TIGR02574 family)
MSTNLATVLKAAMQLSADERARLAESLLDTLDPADESEAESAWAAEISRRSDEIEKGLVKAIPWSQVREAARKSQAND